MIRDAGLKMVDCAIRWDVRSELPALHAAIQRGQAEKWLGPAVDELAGGTLVPPTCRSFGGSGPFYRLPKHRRSFYYSPKPRYGALHDPAATDGAISIKGAEPLCEDFDALLSALKERLTPPVMSMYMTQRRHAEYISVIENKAPGVLYLDEALEEAILAGELQTKHLAAYATLARLPVPLFVHSLPDDCKRRAIERVARCVSERGFERIRRRLEDGIASYAYYYPALPLRSDALHALLSLPPTPHAHLTALLAKADVDALLGQWTELFVRLLYLGYLPCSLGSFQSGMMLQEQNVVVDGGFLDVDSVIPISKMDSDVAFHETMQLSVFVMCRTVRLLLVSHVLWNLQKGLTDYVEKMIHDHMVGRIRRAIETEARPGLVLDERVRDHFGSEPSFEALVAGLKAFYPPGDMLDADETPHPEIIPNFAIARPG